MLYFNDIAATLTDMPLNIFLSLPSKILREHKCHKNLDISNCELEQLNSLAELEYSEELNFSIHRTLLLFATDYITHYHITKTIFYFLYIVQNM